MATDWDVFHAELRARLPELTDALLGTPTMRSRREWRWGRHGSLSVAMAGEKAGQWFDHEAGHGGGFIDLAARELGTDRSGAHRWSAERIGYARIPGPRSAPTPTRRTAAQPSSAPSAVPED